MKKDSSLDSQAGEAGRFLKRIKSDLVLIWLLKRVEFENQSNLKVGQI